MKLQKNQTLAAIAVILILTVSGIIASMPTVNAHTPAWNIPTYAYVTTSPGTVGVGQYTLIVMWLDKYPATAGGEGGDRWRGFQLDITKPDGTKQTLKDTINPTSQVGSTWVTYVPDQVGAYTIVFSWPGQTLTNGTGVPNTAGVAYVGDYFMPATSAPITLTVTQNQAVSWQEPPLPTGYWSRPINDANRGWSQLASNWLGSSWLVGNFQTEGQAPNSPHIVWTKLITAGGIGDAQWSGQPYDVNDYESPWSSPIIMNGIIYYNKPQTASSEKYGYTAVDLTTGEVLWQKNGTDNAPI